MHSSQTSIPESSLPASSNNPSRKSTCRQVSHQSGLTKQSPDVPWETRHVLPTLTHPNTVVSATQPASPLCPGSGSPRSPHSPPLRFSSAERVTKAPKWPQGPLEMIQTPAMPWFVLILTRTLDSLPLAELVPLVQTAEPPLFGRVE
jgi:hypothetical protein